MFKFNHGEKIEDQVTEYLRIFNLQGLSEKLRGMGFISLQKLVGIKMADLSALNLDSIEMTNLNNLITEIKTTILPDISELINQKLVITSVSTQKEYICGWEGCRFGNHEEADIKVDLTSYSTGAVISAMEGGVNFQFGKYWIHNSRHMPIKDLYKKLRPDEENELRPGDIIKAGNVEFMLNRFNVGQAEDQGKSKSMEDKTVIINDLVISSQLSYSMFAVLDGHNGMDCVRFVADTFPTTLRQCTMEQNELGQDIDRAENFYQVIKYILEKVSFWGYFGINFIIF